MTAKQGPAAAELSRFEWLSRGVAFAVGAEAAALMCYSGYLIVETIIGAPADRRGAGLLAAMTLALACGLLLAARAAARRRRAARAPIVTWQILQVALAAPVLTSLWYVGVPLTLAAIAVSVAVFTPGVLDD